MSKCVCVCLLGSADSSFGVNQSSLLGVGGVQHHASRFSLLSGSRNVP